MAIVVEASDVAMRYVAEAERPPHPQILPVVTVSLKLNTYSPSMEKIKNAWSCDFIVLSAFITILKQWWLWSLY
jgi:hypothetical protein